jgi:hypothetical protein
MKARLVGPVFLIQILLISNHYNFLDSNSTAMKFRLISNISMLFQIISMMSLITEGKMLFLCKLVGRINIA